MRRFLIDAKRNMLPFSSYQERDAALAQYLGAMCYIGEEPYTRGSYLVHGFMHIFEDHRDRLP